ncbi:maltodextrin phosphorylase [Candidatus Methylomirabilis lanthanidiphila]|uniref:Alpha-1,4 glucan phosphorylase n=1 Tax=Candidatus Methylomirabilis lanthanidiphila TaxID=2211376 RepID=A0A564ZGY2_9BACT|nr:maltodextrin phosphorylase [Candidatus Methylomirabilis lanthanidiphila]
MERETRSTRTQTSSPTVAAMRAAADARTGMQAADLRQAVIDHLRYSVGRLEAIGPRDHYRALALAVRDRMQHRWMNTGQTYFGVPPKLVCYLSAEFLMGPHLGNNLLNLGIEQAARTALADLGQDLDTVLACEEEPGLGNGGLGRLAACYKILYSNNESEIGKQLRLGQQYFFVSCSLHNMLHILDLAGCRSVRANIHCR